MLMFLFKNIEINLFVPNAPFLFTLKTSENRPEQHISNALTHFISMLPLTHSFPMHPFSTLKTYALLMCCSNQMEILKNSMQK